MLIDGDENEWEENVVTNPRNYNQQKLEQRRNKRGGDTIPDIECHSKRSTIRPGYPIQGVVEQPELDQPTTTNTSDTNCTKPGKLRRTYVSVLQTNSRPMIDSSTQTVLIPVEESNVLHGIEDALLSDEGMEGTRELLGNKHDSSNHSYHKLEEKLQRSQSDLSSQIARNEALHRQLTQELQCSVCQELLIESTTLAGCGHVFCSVCINEWIRRGHHACPNCRRFLIKQVKCPALDTVINIVMDNLSDTSKKERSELITQRKLISERQRHEIENDIELLYEATESELSSQNNLDTSNERYLHTSFDSRQSEITDFYNISRMTSTTDTSPNRLEDSEANPNRFFNEFSSSSSDSDSLSTLSSISSHGELYVRQRRGVNVIRNRRQLDSRAPVLPVAIWSSPSSSEDEFELHLDITADIPRNHHFENDSSEGDPI